MKAPFLLTGLVFDEEGEPLYQAQASKMGKRYRYYISKKLAQFEKLDDGGWRLPAHVLEAVALNPIRELLRDQSRLIDVLHLTDQSLSDLRLINANANTLAEKTMIRDAAFQRDLLQALIHRVSLSHNSIVIDLGRQALARLLDVKRATDHDERDETISLEIAIKLQRKGVEAKLAIVGNTKSHQPDADLCRLIAKARFWFDQLASGEVKSVKEIAIKEKVFDTEITRALPLAFLAPEIIEDILNGRQPEKLNVIGLKRISPLPTNWHEQKKRLGYPI